MRMKTMDGENREETGGDRAGSNHKWRGQLRQVFFSKTEAQQQKVYENYIT